MLNLEEAKEASKVLKEAEPLLKKRMELENALEETKEKLENLFATSPLGKLIQAQEQLTRGSQVVARVRRGRPRKGENTMTQILAVQRLMERENRPMTSTEIIKLMKGHPDFQTTSEAFAKQVHKMLWTMQSRGVATRDKNTGLYSLVPHPGDSGAQEAK